MGMREILMGKAQGKTAWQHLKDRWAGEKKKEAWDRAFARVNNLLELQPGDLVEIGFMDKVGWKVETVLFFRTPEGAPNFIRYGLKRIGAGDVAMLEAMPAVEEGQDYSLSLFTLMDEFELDEELIDVLDNEDVLRRTEAGEDGREQTIDYQKDFVTEATLEIFDKEERREATVFSYNYFASGENAAPNDQLKTADDEGEAGERYLCVEVLEEARWMNFYRGRRLDTSDVLALGTGAA